MFKDWNFWFSVITAVVACIAIWQTRQQIKISNKQHLFDKRVENYLIAKGLIQLYRSNSSHLIHEEDTPILANDFLFGFMTNNSYLEEITPAIKNVLHEPYHKSFLLRLESLKDIGIKIKFLFSGKKADLLGDFVLRYQELLFAMYQYEILLNNMKETADKFRYTLEEAQEIVNEKKHRKNLLTAYENLKHAESLLVSNNVENQLENQIKL